MTQHPPFVSIRRMMRATLASLVLVLPLVGTAADKGAGTQNRDWVTGPLPLLTSPARYPVETQEIFITMRDGTQLGGRLLLPQGVPDGPRPCILLPNGYGHTSAVGTGVEPILKDLVVRGYAGVHVSRRGTGNSGGERILYTNFSEDGYEIVEWMARQPWCNGKVGAVGPSLLGIDVMLIAKAAPPSLKAIIPYVGCGNCYEYLWHRGGTLPGPDRVRRGPTEYPYAAAHRSFDEFWRAQTTIKSDHRKFGPDGIAALLGGGFRDYITPGNIRAFEEIAGPHKMLLVGPDGHGAVPNTPVLPYGYLEYSAMWMDRYLHGLHKSFFDKHPQALIYVQGPNQWRLEKKWPIPDTFKTKLYLSSASSGSAMSLNDGSLRTRGPKEHGATVSIDYSPLTGPFLPTKVSGATADQRADEANVLTWTTQPLKVATEVTGRIMLTFWAEVNGTDADFIAQLTDVAPDGTSTQVRPGFLNASHAHDRSNPTLPQPGEIRKYELEILPTSYVFQAGHRIRLALAGGAKQGAGVVGAGLSPFPALITIYQERRHASYLELPIVGTSWRSLINDHGGKHGRDDDDDDD